MADNTHINKLDEVIKQTLSNYEAPSDVSDWELMERMLDTAPQAASLKHLLQPVSEKLDAFKAGPLKRIFSPYILIAIALAVGVYFIYHVISGAKTAEKTIVPVPQQTGSPAGTGSILNPVLHSIPVTPPAAKADTVVKEQPLPDNAEAVADEEKAKADEEAALKEKKDKKKEAAEEAERIKKEKKEKKEKDKKDRKNNLENHANPQEKHDSAGVIDTHIGEIKPNYQPPRDSVPRNFNQNLQPRDSLQGPY